MTRTTKAGICMDYSFSRIMEFSTLPMVIKTIQSKFTQEEKKLSLAISENFMHTKELLYQTEYFKQLAEIIKKYEEVIIFGQTNAKFELLDVLVTDHLFDKIRIDLIMTDNLSEHQQNIFVRNHFLKN